MASAFGAPVAPGGGWTLASWGARAVAAIIDGLVLAAIAAVIFLALGAAGVSVDSGRGWAIIGFLAFAVVVVVVASLLYQPLWMARTNGQTIGKQALGLRVVRVDGQPMTFGYAFLREALVKNLLVGLVSSATFGLAYLVDLLWPLWDEERRALHDMVVRTRVVRA